MRIRPTALAATAVTLTVGLLTTGAHAVGGDAHSDQASSTSASIVRATSTVTDPEGDAAAWVDTPRGVPAHWQTSTDIEKVTVAATRTRIRVTTRLDDAFRPRRNEHGIYQVVYVGFGIVGKLLSYEVAASSTRPGGAESTCDRASYRTDPQRETVTITIDRDCLLPGRRLRVDVTADLSSQETQTTYTADKARRVRLTMPAAHR